MATPVQVTKDDFYKSTTITIVDSLVGFKDALKKAIVDTSGAIFVVAPVFGGEWYGRLGGHMKDYGFTVRYANAEIIQFARWNHPNVPDKIPAHATANVGVSVLVLSPDESEVLTVFERKKYKPITGNPDPLETPLTTAGREVLEETGLEFDPDFAPKVVFMCSTPNHKTGVTDSFVMFVVRATSMQVKLDEFEFKENIHKWMSVDLLVLHAQEASNAFTMNGFTGTVLVNALPCSATMILGLKNYTLKKYFDVHLGAQSQAFY